MPAHRFYTPRSPGARPGSAASRFPLAPTEAELRRLTAQTIFAGADAWEKDGHVLDARTGVDAAGQPYLVGRVAGSWRRGDEVIITADGRGLHARCSCGTAGPGELCRHAVSLLLHWARHASSFRLEVHALAGPYDDAFDDVYLDDDYLDDDDYPEREARHLLTPRDHLKQLLSRDQMNHLRQIARERGLKVTAKTKAELADRLADELSAPGSLEAALSGLDASEMEILVLADLLDAANRADSETIARAVRALQTDPEPVLRRDGAPMKVPPGLTRLTDLGLLFFTSDETGRLHYAAPVGVTAALGQRPDLLPAGNSPAAATAVQESLGLVEVMRVIVDAVSRGQIGQTLPNYMVGQHIPDGWMREQIDAGSQQQKGSKWNRRDAKQMYRLRPTPGPLTVADRLTLVERTGASVALTDFAVRCLFATGGLQIERADRSQRLRADAEPLQRLSTQTPLEQLVGLISIWLSLPDTLEMTPLLGPFGAADEGMLEYRYTTDTYNWWNPAPSGATALRRLIARLTGRLVPDGTEARWYDLDALLDFLWRLDPGVIMEGSHLGPYPCGYTEPGSSKLLNLTERKHWQRVWKPVVTSILSGPMSWLRLIDIAGGPDGALSFRPRPAALALVGRAPPAVSAAPPRPIELSVDVTDALYATVPPGYPDASVHALFGALGELAGASARGLRYRFRLEGIHQSFQEGVTGPQLLSRLTALAGGSLPPPVEALLRRWIDAYGAVRLYDDLTLIQVSDDFLLRELMATSSLAGAILHSFSPRLAAVDPTRVDELIAELTRLGHSPRVLEGE